LFQKIKDLNKNYYTTLEVSENATQDDIKSSYRKIAKKYHPDKNKESKTHEERFKEVAEAYDTLGDSKKRKSYDNSRKSHFQGTGFNGFGGNSTGFGGFDDFIKNTSFRESSFNINKLHIRKNVKSDIKSLFENKEITISFNRKLMNGDIENKDIKIKINLRKRKYDIRKIAGSYCIVLNIGGMGDESSGKRKTLYGKEEDFYAIGDLIVTIEITASASFSFDNGNILEDINIDLYTALFSKERNYVVDSILGKKYKIDITNPKNLSSLKFTVKGNGVVNSKNRIGDYIATLVVNAPDLDKLTDRDKEDLKKILSKG